MSLGAHQVNNIPTKYEGAATDFLSADCFPFFSVANAMLQSAFHSRYHVRKHEVEAHQTYSLYDLTSLQIV